MRAQSDFEPHLTITLGGGATAGRRLWSVARQPEIVPGTIPPVFDTFALARTLVSGPVISLAATWHRTPRMGIEGQLAWHGYNSRQRCGSVTAYRPEAEQFNRQLCEGAEGRRVGTGMATLLFGVVYRFTGGVLQPYAGVGGGLGVAAKSLVQTTARVSSARCAGGAPDCEFDIYTHERPSRMTAVLSLAAGIAIRTGRYSTLRFEVRDLVTTMATARATPPTEALTRTSTALVHLLAFTGGIQLAYDRSNSRRY